MNISYFGHSSFLIKTSQGKVVTDPFDSAKIGLPFPKTEADILTISHEHTDHNNRSLVTGEPLMLDIPGEYEKNGIRVYGFETYHDKTQGEERGKNTMFKIEAEDISVLHCGDLGHMLTGELIEDIDGVDVLLVPVGGFYTIDAAEARQLVEKLEPSIVIPMHYRVEGMPAELAEKLAPVDDFLEKLGVTEPERTKNLILKKSEMGEERKVVLLERS